MPCSVLTKALIKALIRGGFPEAVAVWVPQMIAALNT